MPHQLCFYQPLGQQRRAAKAFLLKLHPLFMLCHPCLFALSFHLFLYPTLYPHSNLLPFFLQLSMPPTPPLCSLTPNLLLLFVFIFSPFLVLYAIPKGEKWVKSTLSAPLSQKAGESSPFMFLSPSSHKKHTNAGKTLKLPHTCRALTGRHAQTHIRECAGTHDTHMRHLDT